MNTMQQEFDAVVAHLYEQGRPAKIARFCVYRTETGLSCAVGCRIPDSVYEASMDQPAEDGTGTGILSLIDRFGTVLPPEIKEYESLFTRLQAVHDDEFNVNDKGEFHLNRIEDTLRYIAREFGLTFTKPEAK
jgi:hypothetical protein